MTGMANPTPRSDGLEIAVERVREALAGLRFGSVAITVHEGRIVQIDVTERKRLTPN